MTTHKPVSQAPKTLTNIAMKYDFQVTGEISYNGYKLNEFVPQKTSAYISQYDLHIAEMTVRETLDFSLRCQGIGDRAGRLCFASYGHNHALMN
jgi:ABC-type multidrug transport system ATPase subunit